GRTRGAAGFHAAEVRRERFGVEGAGAVDRGHEKYFPLWTLRGDGERLGRQRHAGEEFDAVLLDELLRLAHGGGRIARRVLVDELDGPAEDALGLDVFREQVGGALGLDS